MIEEQELQKLNRRYLQVTRSMARQDMSRAMQSTGLSRGVLTSIAELSLEEIDRMQEMKYLLLQPRLADAAFIKMLKVPEDARSSFISASINLVSHPLRKRIEKCN
jgi:hypothetical protein